MRFTIGQLAARAGVPVKTLRFWSDAGLLPPAGRTASGYRVYGEEALIRLDLVRTLREAGLGLDAIKKVLRRDMSLAEALRLHLTAVEAHAASLHRVAAALRAALRSDEPSEDDVRRLCAVTRLTNEERRVVIENFYARVSEGIPIDDAWRRNMIESSIPVLPDEPTAKQLDAWIELAELVADPTFVERLRANAKEVWSHKVNMAALREANDATAVAAAKARANGIAPDAAEARSVVDAYVEGLAKASGKEANDAMRRGIKERFASHDARASRYWELVAIMRGESSPKIGNVADWKWMAEAILHHL